MPYSVIPQSKLAGCIEMEVPLVPKKKWVGPSLPNNPTFELPSKNPPESWAPRKQRIQSHRHRPQPPDQTLGKVGDLSAILERIQNRRFHMDSGIEPCGSDYRECNVRQVLFALLGNDWFSS